MICKCFARSDANDLSFTPTFDLPAFNILCGFEKPDRDSVSVCGKQLGTNGYDFPDDMGIFINAPGFIGIYSGFQNLKFLADIQRKIGEQET